MNIFNLSQIPKCHQDWSKMKEIPGGRLCESCQRCIVDFREQTYLEIARRHTFSQEPVCGIYTKEQLSPLAIQKKPSRLKVGLLAFLPAFFGQLPDGKADTRPLLSQYDRDTAYASATTNVQRTSMKDTIQQDSIIISGKIISATTKEPLQFATVFLKNYSTIGTVADEKGVFYLKIAEEIDDEGKVTIVGSYVGFATVEQEIRLSLAPNQPPLLLELEEGVVISYGIITTSASPWPAKVWRTVTWPVRKVASWF